MSAPLRGGLVGCGFFAINQLHAWRDVADAEIVAICDSNPARLQVVGDQFGIAHRYTDAGAMLACERLDFVDVATTAPSHRPLVELAAQARVPVICQKPFAPTLVDARAMADACATVGVPLMVHENFRWQSAIRAVKAVMETGEIGAVFWGRVSFRSAYDVFTSQPYLAEGSRFIIEDLGIHALDIARYLFGDAIGLFARTQRVNPDIKGEDVATMLLGHAGGITSVVDCSYATIQAIEPFPETLLEIDGSLGSIRLGQGYRMTVATRNSTRAVDVAPLMLPWASWPWNNIQESVVAIQRHWTACLRAGRETETSGRDNLKTFALVEAAYASAASGSVVAIDVVA